MKHKYFLTALVVALFSTTSNAQSVNMVYDHDTTDLTQLYNLPYNQSELMAVSGFDNLAQESHFYRVIQQNNQLVEMTFNGVDTIWGLPKFKDDWILFNASLNGLGRELVGYDGNSTYFFDFNTGAGSSNPEIIEFEDEIYIIADDGMNRQLFKYQGATSFMQLSFESSGGVEQFIANRGDDYFYTTYNPMDGKWIKSTTISNGIVSINEITPTSLQEEVGDVAILNNEVFMLSYSYMFNSSSFRVDKVDVNSIFTQYYESSGSIAYGRLLIHDDQLLYYRSEPGYAQVLNITIQGQEFVQVDLDPNQYGYIGNHVSANNHLYLIGDEFVVDATGATPVDVINDGALIQTTPTLVTSSSFFLYEVSPTTGQPSGVIEVGIGTNDFVRYTVTSDGGYMYIKNPMVENNGTVKFIFREEGAPPSTNIYEFNSVLELTENTQSTIKIHPNPVVNGSFSVSIEEHGNVNICSLDGKIIQTIRLEAGEHLIDVSTLNAGVYLVQYKNSAQRILIH